MPSIQKPTQTLTSHSTQSEQEFRVYTLFMYYYKFKTKPKQNLRFNTYVGPSFGLTHVETVMSATIAPTTLKS